MPTTTSSPARSWRRDDLAPGSWYAPTPEPLLDALDALLRSPPEDLTSARLPDPLRELGRGALRPVASFFDGLVDYVGLLCLRPARSGGLSQLVDGRAAYEELSARRPEALAVLAQPFHVDRRGGLRPGEPPTARFPVLTRDE